MSKISAVIDIGTSSVKLLIAEESKEKLKTIEYLKNLAPIGKEVFFDEKIHAETTKEIVSILEKYKKVIAGYGAENVKVVATTAAREASNKDVFIDTVQRNTGFKVEVLTPGDVVFFFDSFLYHALGDEYPIHSKNLLIVELGSGNLDVSLMEKGFTLFSVGLPLGPLRLKQVISKFEGSIEDINEAVEEYIVNELNYVGKSLQGVVIDDIILIDENYSLSLATIVPREGKKTHFFALSTEYALSIIEELKDKTPEQITSLYKVPSEVADTITAYALILKSFFKLANVPRVNILQASLCEAVMANEIFPLQSSQKYSKTKQLISVAKYIAKKFSADLVHCEKVAMLAEKIFESLREQMGLRKQELLYLLLSAHLHDIGMFVSNRAHHKHSEYIINSLNLLRLSVEEIKIISCIARYHRKSIPQDNHLIYNSLSKEMQILVQKLGAILRIANSLDSSHNGKAKDITVDNSGNKGHITLIVSTNENYIYEKADFYGEKDVLEEIIGNRVILKIQAG